uniref:Uncharacterized protein n=1 Tax=Rhizophora mucronata TaxID=61149 RepID=A0A2P2IK95_RHIMU
MIPILLFPIRNAEAFKSCSRSKLIFESNGTKVYCSIFSDRDSKSSVLKQKISFLIIDFSSK